MRKHETRLRQENMKPISGNMKPYEGKHDPPERENMSPTRENMKPLMNWLPLLQVGCRCAQLCCSVFRELCLIQLTAEILS